MLHSGTRLAWWIMAAPLSSGTWLALPSAPRSCLSRRRKLRWRCSLGARLRAALAWWKWCGRRARRPSAAKRGSGCLCPLSRSAARETRRSTCTVDDSSSLRPQRVPLLSLCPSWTSRWRRCPSLASSALGCARRRGGLSSAQRPPFLPLPGSSLPMRLKRRPCPQQPCGLPTFLKPSWRTLPTAGQLREPSGCWGSSDAEARRPHNIMSIPFSRQPLRLCFQERVASEAVPQCWPTSLHCGLYGLFQRC